MASKRHSTQNMVIAVIVGLLLGGGSYVAWQGFEYIEFRGEMFDLIKEERNDFTDDEAASLIDPLLEYETGYTGIRAYIELLRQPDPDANGVSTVGPSVRMWNLSGDIKLVLIFVEFLAAAGLGIFVMVKSAQTPYCATDHLVMIEESVFPVRQEDTITITAAMLHEDTHADHPVLNNLRTLVHPSFLKITRCPYCDRAYLQWELEISTGKNSTRVVHKVPVGELSSENTELLKKTLTSISRAYNRRIEQIYAAAQKK